MGAQDEVIVLREGRTGPTEQYREVVEWVSSPDRVAGEAYIFADRIHDIEESRRIHRTLYAALDHHVVMQAEGVDWGIRRAKRPKSNTYEVHVYIKTKLKDIYLPSGGDPRPGAKRV